MKNLRSILGMGLLMSLFILGSCDQSSSQSIETDSEITAITNVNVISMLNNEVLEDRAVLVENGKIKSIVGNDEVPEGAEIIDGQGGYLTPGLAEMHAHIPVPRDADSDIVDETLFLYMSNGITTIRGMLGHPSHIALRDSINGGKMIGPRIVTSGPSLNGNSSPTPDVAARMIREQKELGYDFLKMHPGLSMETFEEIDRVADEVGTVFSGHVSLDVGIRSSLDAQYGSIDHLDGYVEGLVPESKGVDPSSNGFFGINFTDIADLSLLDDLVERTKKADVWIVPTQSLMVRWAGPNPAEVTGNEPEMKYMSPAVRYSWIQNVSRFQNDENYSSEKSARFIELRETILKRLHDAGVGFLLGSDAPQIFNVPGFSIQHEMAAMIDAGLTPYEVLKSGTVNPAIFFGMEGDFGAIEGGNAADLILVAGNPLEDISAMKDIKGVMVKGEWLSREYIDERLKKIEDKYKE